MSLLIGIDVGTTAAKTLLVDSAGKVLADASSDYPLDSPYSLWSEQNPEDWYKATALTIREVLQKSGVDPTEVVALGLSGQMHGLVLLDDSLRVCRPAILWNDQRTGAQCEQITAKIGFERLLELTGNPALTGFTLPKLLWVSENEPEVFAKAAHFLLPKDYVRFRLTGTLASDVADASGTSLFDVKNRSWCDELFDELGIPRKWAPEVFESHMACANVTSEAARETGLWHGLPVVAGAGDQAAQAVGTGILSQGQSCVTIGTSGVVFAPTDAPRIDPQGRLHCFCHAVPGVWHVMGVMLSAGGSLRWFRDNFCTDEIAKAEKAGKDPYELIVEQAKQAKAGCDGLLFLPYLTGERTPYPDPHARGAFIGLTSRHTKGRLVRAVMEGVGFGLTDCLGLVRELGIDPAKMSASGGGARSRLWMQILADQFGLPIATVDRTEGAALGAALLAGVGGGVFDDVREACAKCIVETRRFDPDPKTVRLYKELHDIYQSLYPTLKNANHELSKVMSESRVP